MHELFDEMAPTPDGVTADDMVHERSYVVRVYRKDDQTLVVRGAVRDQKPPGLYIAEDPDPLTVHHMIVDMTVSLPTLEIVAAKAVMEHHPYPGCPTITEHYGNLVGMSIARGYTHKVREVFGGPRGCTHTSALLQAMAPAVVQATWSMRVLASRKEGGGGAPDLSLPENRARAVAANLNTCHMWAEDGEYVANALEGRPPAMPITVGKRLTDLGLETSMWNLRDS